MPSMLVLKPGYSFIDFANGDRKLIVNRPAAPEMRGKDEAFCFPAADPRLTNQLHKFFPYGNPDAAASAHSEATERRDQGTDKAPDPETKALLDELEGKDDVDSEESESDGDDTEDEETEEDGPEEEDPLAALED